MARPSDAEAGQATGHRIEPVIPHKDNEATRYDPATTIDREVYRGRSVVEQCVG